MFTRYADRETLERVKRWPNLMKRFYYVRIYSAEHEAFWRVDGAGYTTQEHVAWVLPFERAFINTKHCGPEKKIQYIGCGC